MSFFIIIVLSSISLLIIKSFTRCLLIPLKITACIIDLSDSNKN